MLDTQLVAFLESKPANEPYDYVNSNACAAAQFNQSIGRVYRHNDALNDRANGAHFDNRLERIAEQHPRTFGALLIRARREFV